MTEYTPTTDEVKHAYWSHKSYERMIYSKYRGEPVEEFNYWLNEIRAEVWDEGHGFPCDEWAYLEMCREYHPNPYRPNEK